MRRLRSGPRDGRRTTAGWAAAVVGVLAFVGSTLAVAGPAAAGPTRPDRLLVGETLQINEGLTSPNGLYHLWMQSDGNLVLYRPGYARVLFATGMGASTFAVMQWDGNFVKYDAIGRPTWATGTDGWGPSTLFLGDDGRLVIRRDNGGAVSWTSNAPQLVAPPQPAAPTDRLLSGQGLYRDGIVLTSPNGLFSVGFAHMMGQLYLRRTDTGKMLWQTGFLDSDWLWNPPDGRIRVLRSDGVEQWAWFVPNRMHPRGPGACTLVLRDNGDLQLIRDSDGSLQWHTNTGSAPKA